MKQSKPLVSVIMPCYNHEKFVADSLESIFNQTYKNLEIIIADNGSTDRTGEIIERYRDKIDKIIVMDVNNISKCEEILYSSCTGEYIAMAHSDDWWEPQKIEKQLAALDEHEDCGACFTWAVYTTEDLNAICDDAIFIQKNRSRNEWQRTLFLNGNCLSHPSIMIKRELMLDIRRYMFVCPRLGDWQTWLEMLRRTNLYMVEECLVRMRRHNNNISQVNLGNVMKDMLERSYVLDWMCLEYSDEEFSSIFASDFVKKDACTKQELLCERLFVLLKEAERNAFMVAPAYRMLCTCFAEPEIRTVIEETYHYRRKDIAEFEQNNQIICLMRHAEEWKEKRENIQTLENISNKSLMLLNQIEYFFSEDQEDKAESILMSMVELARNMQSYLNENWNNMQRVLQLQQIFDRMEKQEFHSNEVLLEDVKCYFKEIENLLVELKDV